MGRLATSRSSKSLPGGRCVHGGYSLLIWLGWGDRDAWTICHLRTTAPLLINWANIRWRHQTFAQKWTHRQTHTHRHTHTSYSGLLSRWRSDRLLYRAFSWTIFQYISCQTSTLCPLTLLVLIHWNRDSIIIDWKLEPQTALTSNDGGSKSLKSKQTNLRPSQPNWL